MASAPTKSMQKRIITQSISKRQQALERVEFTVENGESKKQFAKFVTALTQIVKAINENAAKVGAKAKFRFHVTVMVEEEWVA